MEYKKIGETYYVRMDRGDEIISNLLEICHNESIPSAICLLTVMSFLLMTANCWRVNRKKV